MAEPRITFPAESRKLAERLRMALCAIVVDRRFCDPPGGKISMVGPMDERRTSIVECALGEVALPAAQAIDLVRCLVDCNGEPLPTYADLEERIKRHTEPMSRDAWHEEDGNVLWWRFPIVEPPYIGTPFDDDFPDYATHWTRLLLPDDLPDDAQSARIKSSHAP